MAQWWNNATGKRGSITTTEAVQDIIKSCPKLFENFQEIVRKRNGKNFQRMKKKLSEDEWVDLLFKFCDEHKMMPTANTTYNGHKLGSWFSAIKTRITSSNDSFYVKLAEHPCVKASLDKSFCKKEKKCIDKIDQALKPYGRCSYDIGVDGDGRYNTLVHHLIDNQHQIEPLHAFLQRLCEGKYPEVTTDITTKTTKLNGKKVAAPLIAIEPSKFKNLYTNMLREKYSDFQPCIAKPEYINRIFGNYKDIIYPNVRKSLIKKTQSRYHFISPELMIERLNKERQKCTTQNTNDHIEVRQHIVQELRDHPERYRDFNEQWGDGNNCTWDDYVSKMSKQGEWGGHTTLQAAANAYQRIIHVVASNPNGGSYHTAITPVSSIPTNGDDIWIAYLNDNHYRATGLLDGYTTTTMPNANVENKTLKELMNLETSQKPRTVGGKKKKQKRSHTSSQSNSAPKKQKTDTEAKKNTTPENTQEKDAKRHTPTEPRTNQSAPKRRKQIPTSTSNTNASADNRNVIGLQAEIERLEKKLASLRRQSTAPSQPNAYGECHTQEHRQWKIDMNDVFGKAISGYTGKVLVLDDNANPAFGTSRRLVEHHGIDVSQLRIVQCETDKANEMKAHDTFGSRVVEDDVTGHLKNKQHADEYYDGVYLCLLHGTHVF